MKLLLISSVIPADTISGNVILFRHFQRLKGMEVAVVSDAAGSTLPHQVVHHRFHLKLLKRLANTRIRRLSLACQELFQPGTADQTNRIFQMVRPDLVVTVAHGDLWKVAVREARRRELPLVTFFHDWWPDIAGLGKSLKPWLDKRFRALHRSSTVSLCVCEGMRTALGPKPGDEILFPISAPSEPELAGDHSFRKDRFFKLLYFGNLAEYGAPLGDLLQATKDHPYVRLETRGGRPWWPPAFMQEMETRGLWADFLPRAQLSGWLQSADAFLIFMTFETAMRRRMETGFPSKLVECAQMGKPLVIWGPEYCSAVRWAQQRNNALCITDPSPLALIRAVEALPKSEISRLSAKAHEAAANEFNPELIQRQFVTSIHKAIEQKHRVKSVIVPVSPAACDAEL